VLLAAGEELAAGGEAVPLEQAAPEMTPSAPRLVRARRLRREMDLDRTGVDLDGLTMTLLLRYFSAAGVACCVSP
jgi:hypothetical protein